ncbi:hypothetical protein G210_0199 [Candida maltosa Xu316]|uniref:Uncharacterized protein n=1 Tax=Candida maltosa (strain Xu316) TaxID=1245528 RepID=M3K321_CANMX|nr:hypothetical protein G210_0199 [Candida maltosa Xu316]
MSTSPQDVLHQPTPTNRRSLLSSSLAAEKIQQQHQQQQQQRAFFNINEIVEDNNNMMDDHPEPELLASSVGKEFDGRIIPSSSTISLLSLNQQEIYHSPKSLNQSLSSTTTNININGSTYHPSFLTRKNSMASYSNLQRLQPYQKLTSPPPPQQQQQQHDYIHSNGIPIQSLPPDSPNLDPVSLNGSPSRFWLSSQTPPASNNNSYKNHYTKTYYINTTGVSTSPVLNPVQTPIEEPPMTPLFLNSRTDYFTRVNRLSEAEEEEEEENDDEEVREFNGH